MESAQTGARGARMRGEGAGPGRGRRGLLSGGGSSSGSSGSSSSSSSLGGGFGAAALAAGSRLGWAPRTRTRGRAPGARLQPTTLRPSGDVAAAGLGRAARRDRGRRDGRARAPRAGTRQVGGPGRAGPGTTRRPGATGDLDAPRAERRGGERRGAARIPIPGAPDAEGAGGCHGNRTASGSLVVASSENDQTPASPSRMTPRAASG